MSDQVSTFFDRLASEPQPSLSRVTATIRLDLDTANGKGTTTKHWLIDIDKGTISVSPAKRGATADAVIHTHRSLFDRMVTGEANAMAATLRGEIGVEGEAHLLVAFQRLLPGPPSDSRKESAAHG
jgi:SCP-2 sterol transfer family